MNKLTKYTVLTDVYLIAHPKESECTRHSETMVVRLIFVNWKLSCALDFP